MDFERNIMNILCTAAQNKRDQKNYKGKQSLEILN